MKLGAEAIGRLSALLDEAMDLDDAAHAAWLARLSAADLALRPTLEKLLAMRASRETGDLLDRVPAMTGMAATTAPEAEFAPGDRVGPYRLERTIGQGGMGEVWLAVRDDGQLKRPVALKLPMLSSRRSVLVQRFARERDILGSLAHPNIARLYDAGVADGQPYLALEYVEGRPITTYCNDLKLGLRDRVVLLQQVLGAVQYAHANLVVHRDLKPSNVLVTDKGQAMLLDFGIAKLLLEDASEAAETELTRMGGRAMTLHYAAPEQVSGAPVSIATDVYALGVLAYELLCGQRPFSGKPRELEHAILTADPPKPPGLPTDLTTVVLKALKKVPAERYASADAFAEDLRRWRAGEPVLAQPDSFGYRTRKFVTRHRVGVATGGLVATALFVSSLVAVRQAAEARRQAATAREQATMAQQESRRAQAVQGFLIDLFKANQDQQADPQAGQRTTARELLDRGAARIDQALADSPLTRIDLLDTLADMYEQMRLHDQAAALQARRLALARQTLAANDPRLADALLSYAATIGSSPQRARVPDLLREARAVLDRAGPAGEALRGPLLIEEARHARDEPITLAIRSADDAAAYIARTAPSRGLLVSAYLLAGNARLSAGDLDGAAAQAALAIGAAERRGAGAPAWLIAPTELLGRIREAQLRCDDAEARLRAAIALSDHVRGADAPDAVVDQARLGNLLLGVGRSAEGEDLLAHARSATEQTDPRKTARWRENTAVLLEALDGERGRPDRVVDTLRRNIATERSEMPRSAVLAQHLRELAWIEADLGDAAAARKTIAEADALWRTVSAGASTAPMDARFALARAHVALAAGDRAAALADLAPDVPALPADAIAREIERSAALHAAGRTEEAVAAADAALGRIDALPASCRPVSLRARALERRGEALRDRGDAAGALHDFEAAAALRRGHDLEESRWLASITASIAALQPERVTTRRSR